MTESTSETRELPRTAGYVVVLSRVIYSGIATVAITYGVGVWGLGWSVPTDLYITEHIEWTALFIGAMIVTVAVGFWLWVALSWVTAYALCPSIRPDLKKQWNEILDEQE